MSSISPTQLSSELREGDTPDLNRRRWIIGLSMLGSSMAQLVSLYQTGVIRELPDPPLPFIDSSRVDASEYAYKHLNTPDGFMMLTNYAITAWLAGAGEPDRAQKNPLLPIAMTVKILLDSVVATELGREEWSENKALCAYCQVATLCSYASLALAVPETLSAIQTLLDRQNAANAS